MRLNNLLTADNLFRVDMPAAFSEIATAADKVADNIEKKLDGQINELGLESGAPSAIRYQVTKLRRAIKYLPELNDFLFLDDKEAEENQRKAEKKAKKLAEKAAQKPAKKSPARKSSTVRKSSAPKKLARRV